MPDEPARVLASSSSNSRDWSLTTPKLRPDKTGLSAAVPAAGTSKAAAASSAAKLVAGFEAQYARASPSAARAVPFAPDVAVPRRRRALLRRPVLRCAVPCSRVHRRWVGTAVRDGRSGTCVASRVALPTVRREVKKKKASPVHTHARPTPARALRHSGPRTLAWPALGFVRRACDGARACSQHSVGWILQASPEESEPPTKRAKHCMPGQPSIKTMFSPRVSPSWS